jgi:hypothetical protein
MRTPADVATLQVLRRATIVELIPPGGLSVRN